MWYKFKVNQLPKQIQPKSKIQISNQFPLPEIFHDNISVIVCFEKPVGIFEVMGVDILERLSSSIIIINDNLSLRSLSSTPSFKLIISHSFCFPPETVVSSADFQLNTFQNWVSLGAHEQKRVAPSSKVVENKYKTSFGFIKSWSLLQNEFKKDLRKLLISSTFVPMLLWHEPPGNKDESAKQSKLLKLHFTSCPFWFEESLFNKYMWIIAHLRLVILRSCHHPAKHANLGDDKNHKI